MSAPRNTEFSRNSSRGAANTPIGGKSVDRLSAPDHAISLRAERGRTDWAEAAVRPELPDYLRSGLDVVFVGFNPGDRSSRIGHYYAGRGNQFWNFLFESGLVNRRIMPEADHTVLEFGIGLTDVVKRWSNSSGSLRAADYREGVPRLIAKLREFKPRVVAFNGKLAYERVARKATRLGWQPEPLEGAKVFVLPSTSGRNGSMTRRAKLAYFRRLARSVIRNDWESHGR